MLNILVYIVENIYTIYKMYLIFQSHLIKWLIKTKFPFHRFPIFLKFEEWGKMGSSLRDNTDYSVFRVISLIYDNKSQVREKNGVSDKRTFSHSKKAAYYRVCDKAQEKMCSLLN